MRWFVFVWFLNAFLAGIEFHTRGRMFWLQAGLAVVGAMITFKHWRKELT